MIDIIIPRTFCYVENIVIHMLQVIHHNDIGFIFLFLSF